MSDINVLGGDDTATAVTERYRASAERPRIARPPSRPRPEPLPPEPRKPPLNTEDAEALLWEIVARQSMSVPGLLAVIARLRYAGNRLVSPQAATTAICAEFSARLEERVAAALAGLLGERGTEASEKSAAVPS